jgi:3-oxoadipate enol-lactonase
MPMLKRKDKPTLHYTIDDFTDPWKKRPYLILQHGYSRSGKFWFNWVPHLARHYKIVRPDLRGLGQSTEGFDASAGYRAEDFFGDMLDLFDHLEIDSAHYCGESLGGMIGMGFSSLHPERIRTLTCVASGVWHNKYVTDTFSFGYPSWQAALREMGPYKWASAGNTDLRFPPGTDPGLAAFYAEEIGKSSVDAMIALSELAEVVDLSPFLSGIKAPMLGLYPANAKVADDAQIQMLIERVKNFKLVRMNHSTHTIMSLEPKACAQMALSFAALHDGFSLGGD